MGSGDRGPQGHHDSAFQDAGGWLHGHALFSAAAIAALLLLSVAGASAALLLYQRTSPPYAALNTQTPIATHASNTSARVQPTPSCGTATTPACPTPGPDWIPIASDTPQAVLDAAKKSVLFNVDRSGDGDYAKFSGVGTPQKVVEYRIAGWYTTDQPLSQFYAIPLLDSSGNTIAVAQALLNPAHTAINVQAIVGAGPVPNGAVDLVSRDAAISDVQAQRRIGLRAGASAQLVFIPSDPAIIYPPAIPLKGGGPSYPVWRVPGADGQDYIVGEDGRVFSIADLEAMTHQ